MSSPVRSEVRWSAPLTLRVPAFCAVLAARVLIAFPPVVIRRCLRFATMSNRRPDRCEVLEWRNAVISVSRHCAGHGCLVRSVAVTLLGAAHRRGPTWCTGFRIDPFSAHAWVELDDEPIGEEPVVRTYRRVLTMHPSWAGREAGRESRE